MGGEEQDGFLKNFKMFSETISCLHYNSTSCTFRVLFGV